jgi:glycerol kinase
MSYLLALDQGTTSSRAIVFDEQGGAVSVAQKEFTQLYPQPGWVEHHANEIWSTQLSVAVEAITQAHLTPSMIAAIGITNQRETTVLWDRATGKPIYNAIVWQDRRTAAFCDQLRRDGMEPEIQQRTGLMLDPYFSGTKLRWLLNNVPGARARAEKGELAFGTIDTWLIWNLTGGQVHVTDPSNASRTLLYNIHAGAWDDEMLRVFEIPRAVLPEVRPSSGVFGTTSADIFSQRIAIAGVAGDQQAALFGQACYTPGLTKNTYGTGCFMLMQTGTKPVASTNRLLTTVAWDTGAGLNYALEGSVFIGGAVVQWLRDGLKIIRSSTEVEELAQSVPDSGGVVFIPAFTGLGAPHWDAYARGTMLGITRGTTTAHIARAALEAIAFQVADLLSAMQADSGIELKELRVDGGASHNNLLMQFQADLLGVPVVRAGEAETTALGAAYLAGLAAGVFPDQNAIARQWTAGRRFEPAMGRDHVGALRTRWSRAVARSREWETE